MHFRQKYVVSATAGTTCTSVEPQRGHGINRGFVVVMARTNMIAAKSKAAAVIPAIERRVACMRAPPLKVTLS